MLWLRRLASDDKITHTYKDSNITGFGAVVTRGIRRSSVDLCVTLTLYEHLSAAGQYA
jgi:hypothetical protein